MIFPVFEDNAEAAYQRPQRKMNRTFEMAELAFGVEIDEDLEDRRSNAGNNGLNRERYRLKVSVGCV